MRHLLGQRGTVVCRVLTSAELAAISKELNIDMPNDLCNIFSPEDHAAFLQSVESVRTLKVCFSVCLWLYW
jgi:hypothetical protein